MYERFYGLRESPFQLTANPKFLFLTAQHREALSNLQYGLLSAKAVTLLTGEAGTGKTTLLKTVLDSDACRHVRCVFLNNPTLTRAEFIEILAARFALSPEAAQSKAVLLAELEGVLQERRARGEITALVIDEAQSLGHELLEEIRLLANMESVDEKLLPLVLAGQPELGARLEETSLRQLKQRVQLRCAIAPLDLQGTAGYIASRIRTAGGDAARLFTREAVVLIHEFSRGIPRTVSVMCDNALMNGLALERRPVDREIVLEVSRDFCLSKAETPTVSTTSEPAGPRHEASGPPPNPAETAAPSEPAAGRELFGETVRPRRLGVFSGPRSYARHDSE